MKLSLPILLTLIFLILKLTGHVAWSWWWIFAPLWVSFVVGAIVGVAVYILAYYIEKNKTPEQRLADACGRMAKAIRNQR